MNYTPAAKFWLGALYFFSIAEIVLNSLAIVTYVLIYVGDYGNSIYFANPTTDDEVMLYKNSLYYTMPNSTEYLFLFDIGRAITATTII